MHYTLRIGNYCEMNRLDVYRLIVRFLSNNFIILGP